ncbi:GNAT family N-acetyltransferase [Streptomyces sp. SID5643]|nr:GNAT family N-acetyltransferase [Streptomyces sp. SID5643]
MAGGRGPVVVEDGTGWSRWSCRPRQGGRWGSLVDPLHVVRHRPRTGLGTALLSRAAEAVAERARSRALYLWALEQNTAAQEFCPSLGGTCVEKASAPPPAGYRPGSPDPPPSSASPGPTPRCSRGPTVGARWRRPGGARRDARHGGRRRPLRTAARRGRTRMPGDGVPPRAAVPAARTASTAGTTRPEGRT